MDSKRRAYTGPTFSRRSRLFSLRRLLLAISLTGVLFYYYPTILSTFSSARSQPDESKKSQQQQRFEQSLHDEAPLVLNPLPTPQTQQKVTFEDDGLLGEISKISYPATESSSSSTASLFSTRISASSMLTDAATFRSATRDSTSPTSTASTVPSPLSNKPTKRIPLEAHLMSKCPDARDCLQILLVPAIQKIDNLVDLTLYYIGSVPTSPVDNVTCKHGSDECLGNSISLCAQQISSTHHSNSSISANPSLAFTNCLISSYKQIPSATLVRDCASESGIDLEALNRCVSSRESDGGAALLRDSVQQSKHKGVTKSCTVRLDDKLWCIRDGGEWKDCGPGGKNAHVDELVSEVKRLSER